MDKNFDDTPRNEESAESCGSGCGCGGGGKSQGKRGGRSLWLAFTLAMLLVAGLSTATALAGSDKPADGAACSAEKSACPAKKSCDEKAAKPSCCPAAKAEGAACDKSAPASEAKMSETEAPKVDSSLPAVKVDAALADGAEKPADSGEKSACCSGKSCGGKDKKLQS